MKRITALISMFVLAFLIAGGSVMVATEQADAFPLLPCHPDDIYCPSDPCTGAYGHGGTFYCIGDPSTIYCSGDWRMPVPCSHP
ncbi:MAG: hypothetical protein GY841_08720 [FCB group bacterium]|nr:hypothetical protein [FCB group bacterium]